MTCLGVKYILLISVHEKSEVTVHSGKSFWFRYIINVGNGFNTFISNAERKRRVGYDVPIRVAVDALCT